MVSFHHVSPSKLCTHLSFPTHMPCHSTPIPPAHLPLLNLITRTILGQKYRPQSSSLRRRLHSPVTSSLLGPNIFLSTLFSYTHGLRSALRVRYKISHPHKTTGKIIVLYILIFKFLKSEMEDKRFGIEWQEAFPDFNLLLLSWVVRTPAVKWMLTVQGENNVLLRPLPHPTMPPTRHTHYII